jgi:hypothetical protein
MTGMAWRSWLVGVAGVLFAFGAGCKERTPTQPSPSRPTATAVQTQPSGAATGPTGDPRKLSAERLHQIGAALHNYHNEFAGFPPPAVGQDRKPLLSWRVAILPYLNEQALYREFRQNEPWDSPHNKALLARMPAVYAPPPGTTQEPYTTYIQGFVGSGTMFEPGMPLRLTAVTDGSTVTLHVVEAGPPVPWTKPDDIPFQADKPVPTLATPYPDGFYALFVDRSVRFLPRTLDEPTLRALITRHGAEPISTKLPDPVSVKP